MSLGGLVLAALAARAAAESPPAAAAGDARAELRAERPWLDAATPPKYPIREARARGKALNYSADATCAGWVRAHDAAAGPAPYRERVLVLFRGHTFRNSHAKLDVGACGCDGAVEAQKRAARSHVELLNILHNEFDVDVFGATYRCPADAPRADATALLDEWYRPHFNHELHVQDPRRANQGKQLEHLVALAARTGAEHYAHVLVVRFDFLVRRFDSCLFRARPRLPKGFEALGSPNGDQLTHVPGRYYRCWVRWRKWPQMVMGEWYAQALPALAGEGVWRGPNSIRGPCFQKNKLEKHTAECGGRPFNGAVF